MGVLRRILLGSTLASLLATAGCGSSRSESASDGGASSAGEAASAQGGDELAGDTGGAGAGAGGGPDSVAGMGGDSTELGDNTTEARIDEHGGDLSLAGVSLEIPAGALPPSGAVPIRITELSADTQSRLPSAAAPGVSSVVWASSSFAFTPHGLTFDAPVKVVLPYTGEANYVLRLDDELDQSWELVENVTFEAGLASFETSHFSIYTVAVAEADCDPATCEDLPQSFECGTFEHCGGSLDAQLDCGLPPCPEGEACGAGNTCECVPYASCSQALAAVAQPCGVVPDGCGGSVDCSQVCPSVGGVQNECLYHADDFGTDTGSWECTRPCAGTGECPKYTAISANWWDTCALRSDQTIACWGHTTDDGFNPPQGQFVTLSTGYWQNCAIRVDGTLACWGAGRDASLDGSLTPSGKFTAVSADLYHSCGIHDDGSVECWGYGADGRTTAPSGTFQAISAGNYHSCGVRTDGSVECWPPSINVLMGTPPAGPFTQIVGGSNMNCALRADGSPASWGYGDVATLADEKFSAIDLGDFDACGVRADGTLACAGERANSRAPAGQFIAVAMGASHACALRPDGTPVCWGDYSWGQSTPPGP